MADMMEAFIGVMLAAVIGAGITIPVANAVFVTDTNSVTNETHATGSTLPDTFTVDNAPAGVVKNSETLWFVNASDNTISSDDAYLLTRGDNYTADYPASEFNVTTLSGQANTDFGSGDRYNVSYEGKPNGYIENGATRLVVGFVVLGIAVSIFLASLAPIRG